MYGLYTLGKEIIHLEIKFVVNLAQKSLPNILRGLLV